MEAEVAAHARRIEIAPVDRRVLERWANARASERRLVERAGVVLLAGEGGPASEIAGRMGCSLATVKTWRARYQRDGLDGLRDLAKSGRPLTHGPEVRARLIALACTSSSDSDEGVRRERWAHVELAARVGMSESQAHVILRAAELRPHLTEQWVMSELGPEFGAQAAEVCGLDLDPPENAIVLSVDEKTSIAAREPARPDTLPAPRRPARRDSEYLRNGTRNLFAALQVHSRQLSGMTAAPRNRWDFIAFLDQLEHEIPDVEGREIVAILDNLSTHKTQEVRDRLAEHPRWRLVFTPKHASWLNQVEIFYSILARRLPRHRAFTGPHDLATQMLAFVEHYNLTAQPFTWTHTGKVLAA